MVHMKIDLKELIKYISRVTGFDERDIKEVLEAEREFLIEKGIRDEDGG